MLPKSIKYYFNRKYHHDNKKKSTQLKWKTVTKETACNYSLNSFEFKTKRKHPCIIYIKRQKNKFIVFHKIFISVSFISVSLYWQKENKEEMRLEL